MKTYRRLLPVFSLVFFVCLFAFGCSTSHSDFNPIKNKFVSVTQFYDSIKAVEAICGKGNAGCHELRNGVHFIHSIKSRCVIDHEDDHKYFGNFHGNMKASCKVRYEG